VTASVLIVDDSLTVRMDLAEAFEDAGFETQAVSSLQAARSALGSAAPAVMVLDVHLPDGDGVDFLREVRENSGAQPIVLLLSSESEVHGRIRGLQTGADEYVGKPYDRGYIIAKSQQLLAARSPKSGTVPPTGPVLVIDDSPTFREVLCHVLRAAGYRVIPAGTGEEGLVLASQHRPAAVLVDGMLPGIDGATVIRRIRLDAALRGTPCILLTGSDEKADELRTLEAGADAFLRKGEDVDVILARLAAVCRQAPDGAGQEGSASLAAPKRLLAVDDNQQYLKELAAELANEGYDVALARTADEALEFLKIQLVDCIMMKMSLPGIGGLEACRQIKSAPSVRDIPLILLGDSDERNAMVPALGAGADDFITKGSAPEVLLARVRAQIRRKQFEDEKRELIARELEASQARAAAELAAARAVLIEELELKNRELETFSYSVSHDLRAPLRAIDGFSAALERGYADRLDEKACGYLARVRAGARRMGELIDDLLELSRVGRAPLQPVACDLSATARSVLEALQAGNPERSVEVVIPDALSTHADPRLLKALLENLLGNAWKFTSGKEHARIEVGECEPGTFFVRDNGAGYESKYADKLFAPFQRLHTEEEFEGTGIGLATVQRIVARHYGKVWSQSSVGEGATFFFRLSR
jgi:two-component system, NtrC family, sensor kinase